MIYLVMLGLALLLMVPLFWSFLPRSKKTLRGEREAAIMLHKAQLHELARDLSDARIGVQEYKAAKLEIERRLLAADALAEPAQTGNALPLLVATALAVPLMAFAIYLPGATPNVPSEPHAQWVQQQQVTDARITQFITAIRAHLAGENPNSADASQGEAYLGEALSEQAGTVTPAALALFRQSLANAPANATWRRLDEARIGEAAPN